MRVCSASAAAAKSDHHTMAAATAVCHVCMQAPVTHGVPSLLCTNSCSQCCCLSPALFGYISPSYAAAPLYLPAVYTHCNTMGLKPHQTHLVGYQCAGLKGGCGTCMFARCQAPYDRILSCLCQPTSSCMCLHPSLLHEAYCLPRHAGMFTRLLVGTLCRTLHVRHTSLLLVH